MDIPSFLATYGGPGGLAIAAVWWAISDRKFSAERRAELREDIDREQTDNTRLREDNTRLREELVQETAKRISAESERDVETAKRLALEDQIRVLQSERGEDR